jgi:hypothetical protein
MAVVNDVVIGVVRVRVIKPRLAEVGQGGDNRRPGSVFRETAPRCGSPEIIRSTDSLRSNGP